MLLRILLSSVLLYVAAPLWADTVWLDNGDRLTGEILLLDGGKLALKTKYAGRVLIDWKDIDTLRSDKPLLVKQAGFTSQRSRTLEAAGPSMVRLVNGDSQTLPLASISQLVPPRPFLEDRVWEGNLDAKLDMQRKDNDSDEWKLKGDTRMQHGRWRHLLKGELERETKNDVKNKDKWELNYDLDRFFTEHWFWRSSVGQEQNNIGGGFRERFYGMGPGYRFWDSELGRFDLIGKYNRFRIESGTLEVELNSYSLEWDFKRLLWGTRLEFYSTAEIQIPQIEEIDYILDSEYGLRYRLNDWARLSLLYELDQFGSFGQTFRDERYLLGVGIGW